MEQESLKPCPFCGEVVETGFCGQRVMHDCVVLGGLIACSVAAWNARAAVADEQFAMAVHDGETWQKVRECCIDGVSGGGNCGTTTYRLSCGHVAVMPMGARFAYCPNCGARVSPC